jgi:hypothetical protein
MALDATELYHSANGDRWYLMRQGGRVFVRHQPNEPSGGHPSDTDIESFLARPRGPEPLLRMMMNPPPQVTSYGNGN